MNIRIRIPRHVPDDKIRHIRVLRSLTGLGLKEAKYIIDEMYIPFRDVRYTTDNAFYRLAWHTITLRNEIQTPEQLQEFIAQNFGSVNQFEAFFNVSYIHNPYANVGEYQEWSQLLPHNNSDIEYLENLPTDIDVAEACIALRKMINSIINIADAGDVLQALVVAYNASSKYVLKHTPNE